MSAVTRRELSLAAPAIPLSLASATPSGIGSCRCRIRWKPAVSFWQHGRFSGRLIYNFGAPHLESGAARLERAGVPAEYRTALTKPELAFSLMAAGAFSHWEAISIAPLQKLASRRSRATRPFGSLARIAPVSQQEGAAGDPQRPQEQANGSIA